MNRIPFLPLVLSFFIFSLLQGCKKNETANEDNEMKSAVNYTILALAESPRPLQVYGVWHAGNDYCIWGTERTVAEFESKNSWLINGNNGQPSVNIVILSFVHPLKLLNSTTDATTLNGIPRGMTPAIINYFKSKNIRVMLSIGGITYTDAWDQALAANATLLGSKAAAAARTLGVGIEIDYEQNRNPNLNGLQQFINAYRFELPYDATGINHAARLTIDLGAGDRWLIDICRKAFLILGCPI